MSGTLAQNRWHMSGGYLDFIKGHPYTNDRKFMAKFTRDGYNESGKASWEIRGTQLRLLQRFLQAFRMKTYSIRPLGRSTAVTAKINLTEKGRKLNRWKS